MLKQIIDFLNIRISVLNYCEQLFCLCEIKGDGETREPMQRGSQGEYQRINFDQWNGVGYWRLRADVTTDDAPVLVSGKKRLIRTFPLRFVFAVPRSKVSVDDAYAFQRAAQTIEKAITVSLGDLQLQLGAGRVTVAVNTEKHDPKEVWDSETDGTKQYEPKYELLYGALDMTVAVTADVACFVGECGDIDTDILHTFDFCKPATRERLTDEQVTCLTDALCETPPTLCEQLADVLPADVVADVFDCLTPEAQAELLDSECVIPPCADATITINGDSYGTVPAGGTENIIVESENNNPLGSLVGGNWEVGNAHLRVNGTTVGNLEPEQLHHHYATINGTQAGAWHNPSQTWRMTVLQGGVQVGSLSGTDWVVPVCANATAVLKNTANTTLSTTSIASGASQNITAPDATAVLKNTANTTLLTEAIPSNVSENITAPDATITLNGSAYGSAPSGTTLNVVAPSLSLSTTTSTPAYGASFTVTATATGFTPISYSFGLPSDSVGGYSCTTQAGNSLAITAKGYGAQKIYVTATDGSTTVGAMLTVTVAQMTQVTDFLTNTGIVDATISGAVRTLAMRLDDYGIWTKVRAFYPFVGGTATTHKYNLKDPRDLDAAYRMVFAGGWTHNSNGVTGNGTNTSGDSKLANNVPSQNSLNLGVYNRTAGTGGVEWSGSSSPRTWLAGNISGTAYFDMNNSASTATTTAPADVRGTLMANRTDSASTELNLNAQGQRTTAAASSAPTATNFILGQFSGGGFNTARNYAAAWIADGLTPLEEANLRAAVQTFQTTLSRNV